MKGFRRQEKKYQQEAEKDAAPAKKEELAGASLVGDTVQKVMGEVKALWEKAQHADEYHERYLRALAELDNYRKRAAKDRTWAVEAAQIQLIRGLLPIVDNLQLALSQLTNQSDSKSILQGLILIDKQIESFLESVGLKSCPCLGETFDPHKHEAVLHVASKDHPDHTILEEVQKGYTLHGRVIRHALVKVADNPVPQTPGDVPKETPPGGNALHGQPEK